MSKGVVFFLICAIAATASAQRAQTVLFDDMENLSLWRPGEPGASVAAERKLVKQGRQALRFDMKVDHTTGPKIHGKTYLKSWPKVMRTLFPPMNLSAVDGIEFDIYVTANRESMQRAAIITLLRDESGGTFQKGVEIPLNQWTNVRLEFGQFQRAQVSRWQFYACENVYEHGDEVSFIIDNVRGFIDKPGQEASEHLVRMAKKLKQLKAMRVEQRIWQELNTQRMSLVGAFKKTSWQDLNQASAFTRKCKILEQKVSRAILWQRTRDTFGALPYTVGVETSLRKVFRDDLDFKPNNVIRLNLAGNERESKQILLHPFKKNIKSVSARCSDLIGPDGAVIPASQVSIHAVGYIKMPPPSYVIDRVGWWPDPLLPMDWPGSGKKGLGPQADWFVQKGQTQPLWVTVRCPSGTPDGEYRGKITISPEGFRSAPVELIVKVRNFSLPIRPRLKTAFCTWDSSITRFNRLPEPGRTQRRKFHEFILSHKLNPMGLYASYSAPPVEDAEYMYQRGLNAFSFGYCPPGMQEFGKRVYYRWIRDQREYLARKGLDRLAWVYGWDEPDCRPGFEARIRQMERIFGGILQDVIPGVPRGCTVPVDSRLNDLVTLWVPATNKYKQADAIARQKAGEHVWTYIANGPTHPYANFFIDYPAIDHRMVMWHTWQLGATGFLYYATSAWGPNYVDGPRWPEIPWNPRPLNHSSYNGDGTLYYPGIGTELLSSQRLEVITDGIEDYDYFCLLREGAKELKALPNADQDLIARAYDLAEIPESISAGPSEYSSDPTLLQNHRDKMGDVLEQVRSALPDAVWNELLEKCPPLAKPLGYTSSTDSVSVPFYGIRTRQMQSRTSRHNASRTRYVDADDKTAEVQAVSESKGKGWSDWESPFIEVRGGREYLLEILSKVSVSKGKVRVYLFRYDKDFCPLDHASMKHYGYAPAFVGEIPSAGSWKKQQFKKTLETNVAYVRVYIQCFDVKGEARFGQVNLTGTSVGE